MRQLLQGVGHLHEVGVIHTDLSMANMLVGDCGLEPRSRTLRVTDLGGAAHAHLATLRHADVITTEYCQIRVPSPISQSEISAFSCIMIDFTCKHREEFAHGLQIILHPHWVFARALGTDHVGAVQG